jgi:uncharacterized membrane protein
MWGWGLGLFVLIVTGIAVIVSAFSIRPQDWDERSASLLILEQRYAKGDIKRDEYLEKLRDLVHSH